MVRMFKIVLVSAFVNFFLISSSYSQPFQKKKIKAPRIPITKYNFSNRKVPFKPLKVCLHAFSVNKNFHDDGEVKVYDDYLTAAKAVYTAGTVAAAASAVSTGGASIVLKAMSEELIKQIADYAVGEMVIYFIDKSKVIENDQVNKEVRKYLRSFEKLLKKKIGKRSATSSGRLSDKKIPDLALEISKDPKKFKELKTDIVKSGGEKLIRYMLYLLFDAPNVEMALFEKTKIGTSKLKSVRYKDTYEATTNSQSCFIFRSPHDNELSLRIRSRYKNHKRQIKLKPIDHFTFKKSFLVKKRNSGILILMGENGKYELSVK